LLILVPSCLCGQEFCLICGAEWPKTDEADPNPEPLCHPIFGAEDQHVLRIPEEVEARLNEDRPSAVRKPVVSSVGRLDANQHLSQLADDTAEGMLCRHEEEFMHKLRPPRYLSPEARACIRCHVCGAPVRQFLMQCRGCGTEMCLDCRDELQGLQLEDIVAANTRNLSIGQAQYAS
jgi:hypothetical protein